MLKMEHVSKTFNPGTINEKKALDGLNLHLKPGDFVTVIGGNGAGKSTMLNAVAGVWPVDEGHILLDGQELTALSEEKLCDVRGSEVSMIFQEPMTSLNPVMTVGRQVDEAVRVHMNVPAAEARNRTIEMFKAVGISEPEERYRCYPHQLSGGLRQRVMIAMAMIMKPSLLIADEPTTALDVTVEAQILRLMKDLNRGGTSILLISHNLGVIAQVCDYVYVMYAGQIVEEADIFTLFDKPLHPYTAGLLGAVTSLRSEEEILDTIPGTVPDLLHLPEGCSFSVRCEKCMGQCAEQMPPMAEAEPGHRVRCHLYDGKTL